MIGNFVAKTNSARRWELIDDVDRFFSLVYEYHQGNGFWCITLKQLYALLQFLFVIGFSTFLLQCVNYDILFNNNNTYAASLNYYNNNNFSNSLAAFVGPIIEKLFLSFKDHSNNHTSGNYSTQNEISSNGSSPGGSVSPSLVTVRPFPQMRPPFSVPTASHRKRTIVDAIDGHCLAHLHPLVLLGIIIAGLFFLIHLLRVLFHLCQLCETRAFFSEALNIPDAELQNTSWHEVVRRLCTRAQPEHRLIVNRDHIDALDVYQRILRHQNYMSALVYLDILPPELNFSLVGPVRYISRGLRFNIEWLLFWGPWSPWRLPYALKDDYKHVDRLPILESQLRRRIAWASLLNMAFFPLIFIYQVLFSFFSYSDLIKRDPGAFGTRKYSNYAKERLRHFNELDHELAARLNRSYPFAARYMEQFTSPLAEVNAKFVAFVAASLFAAIFLLSAWDEDVLNIEHVLTTMTVCGAIVMVCRAFISNENIVYRQHSLMARIVEHVHYAPKAWFRNAHSIEVCREFTQMFQLKVQFLVEELLSPILTPYILFFHIRPRAGQLVAFFNQWTVTAPGLGDCCSLAQMDVGRDGDRNLLQSMVLLHSSLYQQSTSSTSIVNGKQQQTDLDDKTNNATNLNGSDSAVAPLFAPRRSSPAATMVLVQPSSEIQMPHPLARTAAPGLGPAADHRQQRLIGTNGGIVGLCQNYGATTTAPNKAEVVAVVQPPEPTVAASEEETNWNAASSKTALLPSRPSARRDRRLPDDSGTGKIELSLLNFATQHPSWEPMAPGSQHFLNTVRRMLEPQNQAFRRWHWSHQHSAIGPSDGDDNGISTNFLAELSQHHNVPPAFIVSGGAVVKHHPDLLLSSLFCSACPPNAASATSFLSMADSILLVNNGLSSLHFFAEAANAEHHWGQRLLQQNRMGAALSDAAPSSAKAGGRTIPDPGGLDDCATISSVEEEGIPLATLFQYRPSAPQQGKQTFIPQLCSSSSPSSLLSVERGGTGVGRQGKGLLTTTSIAGGAPSSGFAVGILTAAETSNIWAVPVVREEEN